MLEMHPCRRRLSPEREGHLVVHRRTISTEGARTMIGSAGSIGVFAGHIEHGPHDGDIGTIIRTRP